MLIPNTLSNGNLADATEVQENFDAIADGFNSSIAGLFEADSATTTGLTFGYGAGRIRQSDGTILEKAAGTLALSASATNYVEINSAGTVSKNTTGFTLNSKPIRLIVTDTDSITNGVDNLGEDKRISFDFTGGSGSSSLTIKEDDGSPDDVYDTLIMPDGSLTDNGDGSVTFNPPAVPFTPRGAWATATAYDPYDEVQNGTRTSSYYCKLAHTSASSNAPGTGASWTTYWTRYAQAGATGAAGSTGATGATGAAGIDWEGAWDSGTAYVINDGVTNDGSSYRCILGHTNHEPPNSTYWEVIAEKGDQGDTGPQGDPGTGDVVGPASATDLAIARFDGVTGELIQNSTVTLDDTGAMTFPEMAAPSTPGAGKVAFYFKTDGKAYIKDDAGTETDLTAAGGGGGGTTSSHHAPDLYLFNTVI